MVLCGILEKSQQVLSSIAKVKRCDDTKAEVPFIDERQHRQIHLQEMEGGEVSNLIKIGSRVMRGPDWKWDDQVNRKIPLSGTQGNEKICLT